MATFVSPLLPVFLAHVERHIEDVRRALPKPTDELPTSPAERGALLAAVESTAAELHSVLEQIEGVAAKLRE